MSRIRTELTRTEQLVFQELLAAANDRVEIAVTLLATLELIKRREIQAQQERMFGRIVITARHDTTPLQ